MDYQVVLSLSARADLRDIVRYISFDAPDRALPIRLVSYLANSAARAFARAWPDRAGVWRRINSRDHCRFVSRRLPPRQFAALGRGHSLLARRPWHAGNHGVIRNCRKDWAQKLWRGLSVQSGKQLKDD